MAISTTVAETLSVFEIVRFDQPQIVLGTILARDWRTAILIHRFQRRIAKFPEEACLRKVGPHHLDVAASVL